MKRSLTFSPSFQSPDILNACAPISAGSAFPIKLLSFGDNFIHLVFPQVQYFPYARAIVFRRLRMPQITVYKERVRTTWSLQKHHDNLHHKTVVSLFNHNMFQTFMIQIQNMCTNAQRPHVFLSQLYSHRGNKASQFIKIQPKSSSKIN